MTEPITIDLVFDDTGSAHVPAPGVARLRALLGHNPQPGETVSVVAMLEPLDESPVPLNDPAVENWLRTEVMASVRELRADPSSGMTIDQVRAGLAQRHAERLLAG